MIEIENEIGRSFLSTSFYNIVSIETANPIMNSKTSDRFHSRSQSNFWHGLHFDIISFILKNETPINNGPHHPILGFGKNIISFDSKCICKLLILSVNQEPEADGTADRSRMIHIII